MHKPYTSKAKYNILWNFCKGLLWLKKLFKSKVIFSLLWWQSASVGKKMCRQVKIVKWNYKSISRYIFLCTFFAKFSTLYRSRPIERPTTIISQSPSKRRRYLSQTINQDSSVCCYLGYVIFWILEQFSWVFRQLYIQQSLV